MVPIKSLIANYLTLFGLLLLTANALIANWGDGLLYARVQSTFFHNVHALSILSICIACFYHIYGERDKIPMWVVAVFATGSMHEITLAVFDTALASGKFPSSVSFQYGFYLSIFIVLAMWKGTHYQRRILAAQFFVLLVLYTFDIIVKPGSTIVGSAPTSDFYNPLTNAVEIASWLIPAALWFLPQKWVEAWRLLPARS